MTERRSYSLETRANCYRVREKKKKDFYVSVSDLAFHLLFFDKIVSIFSLLCLYLFDPKVNDISVSFFLEEAGKEGKENPLGRNSFRSITLVGRSELKKK